MCSRIGSKYVKRKQNTDRYNYLIEASVVFVDDMKGVLFCVGIWLMLTRICRWTCNNHMSTDTVGYNQLSQSLIPASGTQVLNHDNCFIDGIIVWWIYFWAFFRVIPNGEFIIIVTVASLPARDSKPIMNCEQYRANHKQKILLINLRYKPANVYVMNLPLSWMSFWKWWLSSFSFVWPNCLF